MQPSEARTQQAPGTSADPAGQAGQPPVVLTIAGLDPTGGAGITADLKVFAAHGLYGVSAATALTVQSTIGVRRVEAVSALLLEETLACLAEDLPIAGIKIGMLATAANVEAVARFVEGMQPRVPVVLDPVLLSSSGHALLEAAGLERLRARLLPLVDSITPNTDELLLLAGLAAPGKELAPGRQAVEEAAGLLARRLPGVAIVATGGHLEQPDDYVLAPGCEPTWLAGSRVRTTATHGTGCAYSSALLCGLVAGWSVFEAATCAKGYVTEALQAATPMGRGRGAMHHLYAVFPSHRLRPG